MFRHIPFILLFVTFFFSCNKTAEGQFDQLTDYSNPFVWGSNDDDEEQPIWSDSWLQKKLDMTRDQRRQIFEIKMDYEQAIEELQKESRDLSNNPFTKNEDGEWVIDSNKKKRIRELKTRRQSITQEFSARAEKVLLPHQIKTRNQIRFGKIISKGFIRQLSGGRLDVKLDISPAQKKKLNSIKSEYNQKINEAIANLMDEAKEEMLKSLDRKQRDSARDLIKEYEYRAGKNAFSIVAFELNYFSRKKKK